MHDHMFWVIGEAAGQAAAMPEFEVVRRRASRMRLHRRMGVGAVGVLAALGAVALTVPQAGQINAETADQPIGKVERVLWVGAADSRNLFATVMTCNNCQPELVASDNGGQSWVRRGTRTILPGSSSPVVTGKILIAAGASRNLGQAAATTPSISLDGGKTWRDLHISPGTADVVPPGSRAVDCAQVSSAITETCRVFAINPASGLAEPLATQPAISDAQVVNVPVSAGIWVQGFDPVTRRPQTAVSKDGGRTWAYGRFDSEPPANERGPDGRIVSTYRAWVVTNDGNRAYALFSGRQNLPPVVYRSDDGGRVWQRVSTADSIRQPLSGPAAMVTADGSHVVSVIDGQSTTYLSSVDGQTYARTELEGLAPSNLPPTAVTSDFYLSWTQGRIMVSGDGRTWRVISF